MTDIDQQVCDTMASVIRDWCRAASDKLLDSGKSEAEAREILNACMQGEAFKEWMRASQAKLRRMFEDERPHTIH